MLKNWSDCKNILVIRADNMGDVIMSSPAIRGLKETLGCRITLLTSSMGKLVAPFVEEIDDVIVYDLPWIKAEDYNSTESFTRVVEELKERKFDGAVIFTVFSQNPLPAAMLAWLANIPRRLAYCRENPYNLLTEWVPDKEPYDFIVHQVLRDVALVNHIGVKVRDERLRLSVPVSSWYNAKNKMLELGMDIRKRWIVVHPGVSEEKRKYPLPNWKEACRLLIEELDCQVIITGSNSERQLAEQLQLSIGANAFSAAGLFQMDEFIELIERSPLVVSVNTATIHIAAAVQTPVVVLYALTNPQHTPWKVPHRLLMFDVPLHLRSRNEVLQFTYHKVMSAPAGLPTAHDIVNASLELLAENSGAGKQAARSFQ